MVETTERLSTEGQGKRAARFRRRLLFAAALLVLTTAVAVSLAWLKADANLRSKPRVAWKGQAIADVARMSADEKWLSTELAALKAKSAVDPDDFQSWVSDHLMLMKNGDWIVYSNICRKQNLRIPDLFIGRGSDGKWYYSTFHFCVGAITLLMSDSRPASLGQFVDWYYLEGFDGRSDKCLDSTWPFPEWKSDPKASKRGRWSATAS